MILCIVGPTGVGKTKLSIELAKLYNAEIINADSTQIYKYLNIGTAKITEVEKEGIIHHLIDIKDPAEKYTVYDYQKEGRQIIADILSRQKNVIIVGGSGLYIKALLYDYNFKNEEEPISYELYSDQELYEKLLEIDPETLISKNNRQRVIRALNYFSQNDMPISMNQAGKNNPIYDFVMIGLTMNREELYQRIRRKTEIMFENGLLLEVKDLLRKYLDSHILNSAIGYKELKSYYDSKYPLEEAITEIKDNSTNYAKRQYTWFNNQFKVNWFEVNLLNFNETIKQVTEFIK